MAKAGKTRTAATVSVQENIAVPFSDLAGSTQASDRRMAARKLEIYLAGKNRMKEPERRAIFDLLCQLGADMDSGVRELAGHALIRGKFINSIQFGLLTAYADPRVEHIAGKLEWDLAAIVFKLALTRLNSPDEQEQLRGIITLRKIAKFDRNYSLAASVLKNLILNSTSTNIIVSAMETLLLLSDEHGVEEDSRGVRELFKEMSKNDSFVLRGMLCHAPGFFSRILNGQLSSREKKACQKRVCAILGYTFEVSHENFLENLESLLRHRHPLIIGRNLSDEDLDTIRAEAARLLRSSKKGVALSPPMAEARKNS